MKQTNIGLSELYSRKIPLGRVDGNEHTQIVIDCSEIYADYPNTAASLIVSASGGECYSSTVAISGSTNLKKEAEF